MSFITLLLSFTFDTSRGIWFPEKAIFLEIFVFMIQWAKSLDFSDNYRYIIGSIGSMPSK